MKTPSTESFHSTKSRPSSVSSSPPPPVPLTNTFTAHNVGLLNSQCQTLGLSAQYQIDGDQATGFGGFVQLGPHTITRDERWTTKKAAREGLAQKALATAKELQRKKDEEEGPVENWMGMLNTFHQTCGKIGDSSGPNFTEYTIGSQFACTCLISLHPTPFGSESVAFTSKKAARMSAARDAMKFLISFGYATSDGKPGPNMKLESSPTPAAGDKRKRYGMKSGGSVDAIALLLNNTDAPFAQKVNEICPLLGLKVPHYRLEVADSSLYSGAAYFTDEPLLRGPIGEVENIFGKKNAKEESARGVWKVLMDLVARRGLNGSAIDGAQEFW